MKEGLLILLCLPMIGFGQGWVKTFNFGQDLDAGWDVEQTLDGGYIIFGDDIIKTDYQGDTIWTNNSYATSGFQNNDRGYVYIGEYNQAGLVRTDSNLNLLWFNDSLYGSKLIKSSDDNYIVLENNCSLKKDCNEISLTKADTLGNPVWSKIYFPINTYPENSGNSISLTSDNGFVIFGSFSDTLGGSSALIIKTNYQGDTIWTRVYNNFSFEEGQQTLDGGYVAIGHNVSDDILLIKFDNLGNILWTKQLLPNTNSPEGISMQQTTDNGYIITGYIELNNTTKVLLLKTDSIGDTLWTNQFGNPYGYGECVKQTNDGGYIVTGGYWNGTVDQFGEPINSEIVLIKTNHLGTLTSAIEIPFRINRGKLLKVTDILGRETNQTNQPHFYIYDDGIVEKRIVIE